jgi:hypothetical protein
VGSLFKGSLKVGEQVRKRRPVASAA